MQKLHFESKWDKTLIDQDRERIKESFKETILAPGIDVQFTSLWQAKNHRDELLVTVLIHNTSDHNFSFYDQYMTYTVDGIAFAEHVFSLPITVANKTSMPWTFIFPVETYKNSACFEDGILHISSKTIDQ